MSLDRRLYIGSQDLFDYHIHFIYINTYYVFFQNKLFVFVFEFESIASNESVHIEQFDVD